MSHLVGNMALSAWGAGSLLHELPTGVVVSHKAVIQQSKSLNVNLFYLFVCFNSQYFLCCVHHTGILKRGNWPCCLRLVPFFLKMV